MYFITLASDTQRLSGSPSANTVGAVVQYASHSKLLKNGSFELELAAGGTGNFSTLPSNMFCATDKGKVTSDVRCLRLKAVSSPELKAHVKRSAGHTVSADLCSNPSRNSQGSPRKRSAAPLPCTMQNSPDCTATRAWMLPQSQKANSIRDLNQNKLRAMSEVATKTSPTPDSPAPVTHPPTCPTLHPPTRTANQHMQPLSFKVSGPPPPQRHPHVVPRTFHRFRLPSPTSSPHLNLILRSFLHSPLALQPSVQQVLSVSLFDRPSSGRSMVTAHGYNQHPNCPIALLNCVSPYFSLPWRQ